GRIARRGPAVAPAAPRAVVEAGEIAADPQQQRGREAHRQAADRAPLLLGQAGPWKLRQRHARATPSPLGTGLGLRTRKSRHSGSNVRWRKTTNKRMVLRFIGKNVALTAWTLAW